MEWISVKDRLPNEDDCYGKYYRVIIMWSNGLADTWNIFMVAENVNNYKTGLKVTHWMPLPKPPKEE